MDGRRLRNALWLASGAIVAGYLVLLLAWQEAPFALTFDDAYYYLGIARNVSAGRGSTFDGINPTNGYHPLWLGLCTLLFRVGLDDLAAARAALAVQLVLGYGGALAAVSALVARTADGANLGRARGDDATRRRIAHGAIVTVFALVAANPFMVRTFVNGMESGVVVVLYALVLAVAPRDGRWLGLSTQRRATISVLLAITFLGRTDAVLLLACLGLWVLCEVVRSRAWPAGLRALAELFGLPALTIVAYLVLNQLAFGTAVQVSGLVKRAALTPMTVVMAIGVAALAMALGRHGFRRTVAGEAARRPPRFALTGGLLLRTAWFAGFCILVIDYYTVLQTQQWLWYYAPIALYGFVLLTVLVADLTTASMHDAPAAQSAWRAAAPVMAIVTVPFALGLLFSVPGVADPQLRSIQLANHDAGEWIRTNLAEDAVLASWDAGAVGYFSHRNVVNLDGVVNSLEYYDASRHGRAGAFLRDRHVGWITNHGPAGGDPAIISLVRNVYGDAAARDTRPVYQRDFVFNGTTTGSAGSDNSGSRTLGMYVYEIPRPTTPGN